MQSQTTWQDAQAPNAPKAQSFLSLRLSSGHVCLCCRVGHWLLRYVCKSRFYTNCICKGSRQRTKGWPILSTTKRWLWQPNLHRDEWRYGRKDIHKQPTSDIHTYWYSEYSYQVSYSHTKLMDRRTQNHLGVRTQQRTGIPTHMHDRTDKQAHRQGHQPQIDTTDRDINPK